MSMTCESDPNYNIDIFESDLISIDKKEAYTVNDKLYFNCSFSRYLSEIGFENKTDIYKSTGSENFILNFTIYKKNEQNEWIYVDDSTSFVAEKGSFDILEYQTKALCALNKNTNIYEFRGAYTMSQPGEYKLEIYTELRPKTILNTISINIKTTVFEFPKKDYEPTIYLFTVN